jgi:hypothetical protein
VNGEFQKHNSRVDDSITSLHNCGNSNDSGGWRQSIADCIWPYFALFLGMLILAILFLTDEKLGE